MKIYFSDDTSPEVTPKNSVFLAGPTPRDKNIPSWRPKAIELFEKFGFKGTLFVPEHRINVPFDYLDQVEWERKYLDECSVILFWVPRKLPEMPAFTTNVEFGRYISIAPNRCVYGRPDDADKNKYLDWLYTKEQPNERPCNNLEALVKDAVDLCFVKMHL